MSPQYLGDGALVYFGYPASHEDDTQRSIRAGLALIERTHGLTMHGAEIRVRIGVATGLVVVGDKAVGSDAAHEPRIMGETPNVAARLQGMAQPGEIVIAGSTRQLVGALFAYEDLGLVELKGVPRPVAAWKVLHATGLEDRFRALRSDATPFVGREKELDLLLRRWRQLREEGGKAVFIAGEAGLGKSRLLAAAREMIAADDPQVVTYFCSQNFTNTALYPIIRQMERACHFGSSDTQDRQLRKLEAFLGKLYTPEALSLFADLLSIAFDGADHVSHLSPAERRKATFDLLIQHLTTLAEARPLAVVFEDIHWADASTLEFLDLLIDAIEVHSILLLATHRPEFQRARASHARVTDITLAPLPARERRRLIEAVAGPGSLSQELIDEIAERTDGVPLFAEELTKATVEADRGGAGATLVQKAARGSDIPATLHASLMARLDWLGPTARQVAQTGAVIGREFSHALLRSVWTGRPGEIKKSLKQLERAGLIFARGAGGQANYSFKHALVQDAAYSTLLRGQKRALHGAVAKHLSERANAEALAELIARHFREARQYQHAAEWRLRAGEASNKASAYREASQNLQEGLADALLLPNTRERKELELKLNLALCVPYNAVYGMTSLQAAEVLERAEALTYELGRPRSPSLLYHRYLVCFMKGEYKRGRGYACELERTMKHEVMGLRASALRIFIDMQLGGDLSVLKTEMQEVFERMCQYGPEIDGLRFAYTYDCKVAVVPAFSSVLLQTGYYDQAVRICDFGRTRAHELKHSMSLCNVLCFEIAAHDFRGDLAHMQERCDEVWEISSRYGLAFGAHKFRSGVGSSLQ